MWVTLMAYEVPYEKAMKHPNATKACMFKDDREGRSGYSVPKMHEDGAVSRFECQILALARPSTLDVHAMGRSAG